MCICLSVCLLLGICVGSAGAQGNQEVLNPPEVKVTDGHELCSTQSGVLGPKTWSFGGTIGMCYCWVVSAVSVGCCFNESHSGKERLN